MIDLQQLFGSRTGQFERLLAALATDEKAQLWLQAIQPDIAVFAGPRTVVLVRYTGDDVAFEKQLTEIMSFAQERPLELVVLGGPAEINALIKKVTPAMQTNRVTTFHIPEIGELWRGGSKDLFSTPIGKKIDQLVKNELPDPDWPKVQEKLTRELERAEQHRQEIDRFAATMAAKKPIATYVILAVIGVVYALQTHFGGATSTPVLTRLGGLVGERVWQGEWWRLVSCAFLHGGAVHLAFNAYVLYALGSSLERILGSSRFLILYVASAIGGSLASGLIRPEGLSVGASGALWGLLAAEAVLAYRPNGLIPQPIADNIKKTAIFNLVLNIANSFRPRIDMSAHFGGGAVGALLMLSGVLTVGVKEGVTPRWIKVTAGLLGAVMFGGLLIGIANGRAWELKNEPQWTRVEERSAGISFELPTAVSAREEPLVYGDPLTDPIAIQLHEEPRDDEAVIEDLLRAPQGATLKVSPLLERAPGTPLTATYVLENGIIVEVAVGNGWRVMIEAWPDFAQFQGVGPKIITSIQPL